MHDEAAVAAARFTGDGNRRPPPPSAKVQCEGGGVRPCCGRRRSGGSRRPWFLCCGVADAAAIGRSAGFGRRQPPVVMGKMERRQLQSAL